MTAEDRAKVPLQAVKPVVLRCTLQEEKRARDGLGLTKRVNELLREASSAGRGATLVYVDAEDFPESIQAGGRYKVEGDKVTVNVALFSGEKEVASFTCTEATGKTDDLAKQIAKEIERQSLQLAKGSK